MKIQKFPAHKIQAGIKDEYIWEDIENCSNIKISRLNLKSRNLLESMFNFEFMSFSSSKLEEIEHCYEAFINIRAALMDAIRE